MYQNIKSCISHNGQQSVYFQCFRGVRQGENLSPILSAIFLNDLETFLENNNCKGVDINFRYEDLTLY